MKIVQPVGRINVSGEEEKKSGEDRQKRVVGDLCEKREEVR